MTEESKENDATIEEDKESFITSISVLPTELEKTLSQAINLSPDNTFHEPTCLICSSPYRTEIEEKWVETKSHADIKDLLKGRTLSKISTGVIDNHMRFHYERDINQHQMREYVDRIKRYSTSELTTLDRIQFALSALTERIVGINAITPSGDYTAADIEKIKSAELTKLMGAYGKFTKLQADLMGEMKDTGDLISIPKEAFIHFFNKALTEAKTEDEKEIVNKILTQLASLSQA